MISTKAIPPEVLSLRGDCYLDRKHIPHNMKSSYLHSLVDLRRFELPTPTMRMWCAPNCATSPYHKNYTAGFSLCQGKRNPCTQFQLCDIINKKQLGGNNMSLGGGCLGSFLSIIGLGVLCVLAILL